MSHATKAKAIWGLAGLGLVLFMFSWLLRSDDDGWRWVAGGIAWFGFLICLLAIIVIVASRVVRGRRKPA